MIEILFIICFLIGLFVLVDIAYCLTKSAVKWFRSKKGGQNNAS